MARLQASLSRIMDAYKEVSATADQSVSVLLAGDAGLVSLAQQEFSTGGMVPATWVGRLEDMEGLSPGPGEILVLFVKVQHEAQAVSLVGERPPKGGLVLVVDEGDDATGCIVHRQKRFARLSFSDSPGGWRGRFAACAKVAGDRVIALGRRYPMIRKMAADQVMQRTALQNGLVALAFIIPGADMPAMTINQAKMVLSIGSMYGAETNQERAIELVTVVGAGFGFRALTRKVTKLIPGSAWLTRIILGYAATLALGKAAVIYYEEGAPASTSRVVGLVRSFKR